MVAALSVAGAFLLWPDHARAAQEAATPLWKQSQDAVEAKSQSCLVCHTATDSASMHPTDTVQLGCTDCHGGKADFTVELGFATRPGVYEKAKREAHVQPRLKNYWKSSANPERANTARAASRSARRVARARSEPRSAMTRMLARLARCACRWDR